MCCAMLGEDIGRGINASGSHRHFYCVCCITRVLRASLGVTFLLSAMFAPCKKGVLQSPNSFLNLPIEYEKRAERATSYRCGSHRNFVQIACMHPVNQAAVVTAPSPLPLKEHRRCRKCMGASPFTCTILQSTSQISVQQPTSARAVTTTHSQVNIYLFRNMCPC